MNELDLQVMEALEDQVPVRHDAPPDWHDVLARAEVAPTTDGRARPAMSTPAGRRPRLILAAVGALVLIGAGTAYALAREFLVGDPAPPAVKEQAGLLNEVKGELIPRVHEGPGIRVGETRLAASLDASTGRVYMWVAPTERSGYCLFKQIVGTELPDGRPNLSGGCGRGEGPIDSNLSGTRVRDGRWLPLIFGRVDQPIQRLEITVKGRSLAVPLQGRFFLFELPGIRDGELPDVVVVGYDAQGREAGRRTHVVPAEFRRPPRPVDISGLQPLLEIETRRTGKPIRLYVAERDGERCTVLVSPGGTSTGCGGRSPMRSRSGRRRSGPRRAACCSCGARSEARSSASSCASRTGASSSCRSSTTSRCTKWRLRTSSPSGGPSPSWARPRRAWWSPSGSSDHGGPDIGTRASGRGGPDRSRSPCRSRC